MRNAKWLVAALGLITLTAGCVQDSRYYPNTGYNAPRAAAVTGIRPLATPTVTASPTATTATPTATACRTAIRAVRAIRPA